MEAKNELKREFLDFTVVQCVLQQNWTNFYVTRIFRDFDSIELNISFSIYIQQQNWTNFSITWIFRDIDSIEAQLIYNIYMQQQMSHLCVSFGFKISDHE